MQMRQIAGMRGLVANPKGEIIPRPIKSNFREGLSVLEYFISTHGARKGLADTALRTADSGYLTRRLVDVVAGRHHPRGRLRHRARPASMPIADGRRRRRRCVGRARRDHRSTRASWPRTSRRSTARSSPRPATDLGDVVIDQLVAAGVDEVRVRSVLTCECKVGTCATCYGRSLATGKLVDVGEAVGIIAAQSIGEPGTQLTMRTFHTGGVAGEDITHGLPRVRRAVRGPHPQGQGARSPRPPAGCAIEDAERSPQDRRRPRRRLARRSSYPVSRARRACWSSDGDRVEVGQQLIAGAVDPQEVLRILGPRAVQQHLVDEVQEVYRSRACRSTTSTSRSSSGRCCAG